MKPYTDKPTIIGPDILRGEALVQVIKLRSRVHREDERPVPKREIRDEHDAGAFHWRAYVDSLLVGAARLSIHENVADIPDLEYYRHLTLGLIPPIGCFNRIVVLPSFRKKGIGTKMLKRRPIFARQRCRSVIACTDDKTVRKFLREAHFRCIGQPALSGFSPGS